MKLRLKKDKLLAQKRIYVFLIILFIISLFLGLLIPLFLTAQNKEILTTSVSSIFNNVANNIVNYKDGLTNSLFCNMTYLIMIWLLGISLVGSIIVLILFMYKGFILGFSISSIILVYGFKGILGAFTYIFPGMILAMITTMLLTFYSLSFSMKLFKYLFLKENLNFKLIMNRYIKILVICFIAFLLVTLSDVYLSPIIMKLFTFLIK